MSLASNFARSVKVELIAKLATSYEAYDGGTLIKNVAPHNVRDYFRKYGSTARKFDHIEGDDIYVGYVRMPGKPEFLSAIVLAGEHAVAVSFDSETDDSNDFLTLMAKKEFAERMTAAVQRASTIMRKVVAPTPVAPAAAPKPTVAKKDNSVGWMLIALVAVIGGAIFLIPMLTEQTAPETTNLMANFRLQDSYDVTPSDMPPHVSDFAPPTYSDAAPVVHVPPYEVSDGVRRRANSLSPDQQTRVQRWLAENEICRGGGSDVFEAACAKREATGRELNAAGLCYGHDEDRGGVDFFWHVCEAGSHR